MEEDRLMDSERGEEEEDYETLKPRFFVISYLTLTASIGGLVFGYYVGFIIARLGVLSDLDSILNETIRTGLVGAILGAAAGGWTNDCWGRKRSILIADALLIMGALLLMYCLEIIGCTFIAFGIGMISMTSPLYISEISPPKLRDILVSINFILYGAGKLSFFYFDDTDSTRATNYTIALAGIPALLQICLMSLSPEPPMWLYKKGREDDAIKASKNIYTCCEAEKEFDVFSQSIRRETIAADESSNSSGGIFSKICSVWSSPSVRKQIVLGTSLQVVQQLMGINALIYCMPSIFRMIGADTKSDILSTKKTLGASIGATSIFGGFSYTFFLVKGFGKKKILCWGVYSVLGSVIALCFVFILSPNITELVSRSESTQHFNNTCLSYITAPDADSWNCITCLQASPGCGFCRGIHYNILGQSSGACLIADSNGTSQACTDENRSWITERCEINDFGLLMLLSAWLYKLSYSVSLEIIPWIMNSQMYPTEVRGIYGGIAAAANWTFFLIIIILSFLLTKIGGLLLVFLLISLFAFFALGLIKLFAL